MRLLLDFFPIVLFFAAYKLEGVYVATGVLMAATAGVIAVGIVLTLAPVGQPLGFRPLPWQFFAALALLTAAYLLLVEITKAAFYAEPVRPAGPVPRTRGIEHRIGRRAAKFSHPGRLR